MNYLICNNTLLSRNLFQNRYTAKRPTRPTDEKCPYYTIFPYKKGVQKCETFRLVYHDEKNLFDDCKDTAVEIDGKIDIGLTEFDGIVIDALHTIFSDQSRYKKHFTLTELLHTVYCNNDVQLTPKRRELLKESLNRLYKTEIGIVMNINTVKDDGLHFRIEGRLANIEKESGCGKKVYYTFTNNIDKDKNNNDNTPILTQYTISLAKLKKDNKSVSNDNGEQWITATDYALGTSSDTFYKPVFPTITDKTLLLARYMYKRLEQEKHFKITGARRSNSSSGSDVKWDCTIRVYSVKIDKGVNRWSGILGAVYGNKYLNSIKDDDEKLEYCISTVTGNALKLLGYYKDVSYISDFEYNNKEHHYKIWLKKNNGPELWKNVAGSNADDTDYIVNTIDGLTNKIAEVNTLTKKLAQKIDRETLVDKNILSSLEKEYEQLHTALEKAIETTDTKNKTE